MLENRIRNPWIRLWCSLLFACFGNPFVSVAGQFRAAVAKVDITPDKTVWLSGYGPRQSTGIHDRLYHRVVAMDDGNTQFFLVSSDVSSFSVSVYDEALKKLHSQTGIQTVQVWWTTTHTHSAPGVGPPGLSQVFMPERYQHEGNTEYSSWFTEKLIEGINLARTQLVPARLGTGWGMSMANINRRARNKEGPAFLGMNPDGPADRQIGLIRLEKEDRTLLALIANYGMHGTVLGPANTLISGDAPGVVADYVEKALGAPMLYINGAAGDLAPIYSVRGDFESGHIEQFKVLLGDKIIAASRTIAATTPDVRLTVSEHVVETPQRVGMGWAPDLGAYKRTTSSGQTVVRLPLRFLEINDDIAVWGAPIELFNEISTQIRNLSPFPYTFYFGYCNGWLGYLPTKAEFANGGYEPGVSPFTDQAESDLVRAVVSHFQGMSR